MKLFRPALLSIGLMCSALVQATPWLTTQLAYQPLDWDSGEVTGLNNQGQAIGVLIPPFFAPGGGFVDSTPMTFVTGPNGGNLQPVDPKYEPYQSHCLICHPTSTPTAINNASQISVITAPVSAIGEAKVSLAGPGGHDISPPVAMDIFGANASLNSSGQLAGTFSGPPSGFLGYVTDANGNNPHLLGMLDNSHESHAYGINDSGQLLASGVLTGSTDNKTFVTGPNANGVAFELSNLGPNSFVGGLNNSAQIFGGYQAIAGGEFRAFITGANGTGFTDIGSLGGHTFANAINNNGLVVGTSGDKVFLYGYKGGGILDLNALVTLSPGEYLTNAPGINDRGQIVANSNLGKMYLLTPIPEPATYLMFAGGLTLLYWHARRTGFT